MWVVYNLVGQLDGIDADVSHALPSLFKIALYSGTNVMKYKLKLEPVKQKITTWRILTKKLFFMIYDYGLSYSVLKIIWSFRRDIEQPISIKDITFSDNDFRLLDKIKDDLIVNDVNLPQKFGPKKIINIDIININFFDWNGEKVFKGGAERYVYDLAHMLQSSGFQLRIIQNANFAFEKDFHGISVIGVQTNEGQYIRGLSKKFRKFCINADLIIASPLDLACELYELNVIGINHGIHWDHKLINISNISINNYQNIFDALKICLKSVAVDTNFLNWVQTYDYSLRQHIAYIPNYFDGTQFFPVEKNFEGRIRVLYPRRLYDARGIFITLKAFDYLFTKHADVELYLVGQADPQQSSIILEFINKHPGRVFWEEFNMNEMPAAYQASHITLIPTLYSEGTSLSCLEAMATNNAIIATNVGGLPNLIINHFNGLLIDPNTESLIKAINFLLFDRNTLRTLASNSVGVSRVFEKNKWLKQWKNVISEINE